MVKLYHVLLNHFLNHLRCLFDPVAIYSKTTAFHGLGVCSLVLFSPYMRKVQENLLQPQYIRNPVHQQTRAPSRMPKLLPQTHLQHVDEGTVERVMCGASIT
ncbi:hypothetical protein ERO13_D12G068200v2 [Gossypium hirsutum]|uniref:Uncharacterized protein n=1 Tax=Gossypium hirsutum TaxID=3635 RepID=A0ABM3BBK0_GOSHI|nr:uncharacterized protein LOC107933009 [Gossypium hirsutum]KAG4114811.1 hypothetical protein ERO13_D12G068200v2 [Gossypium hirsutum]